MQKAETRVAHAFSHVIVWPTPGNRNGKLQQPVPPSSAYITLGSFYTPIVLFFSPGDLAQRLSDGDVHVAQSSKLYLTDKLVTSK